MGYHQISAKRDLQDKLAFARPNATMLTYHVMPLRMVNGPAMLISFIHVIDSSWKELANLHSIHITNDTNTSISIDNILSWAKSLMTALV